MKKYFLFLLTVVNSLLGLCQQPDVWPKAYLGRGPLTLTKDVVGNIFMEFALETEYHLPGVPNLNHMGAPLTASLSGSVPEMIHYRPNGISNWTNGDWLLNDYNYSNQLDYISCRENIFFENIHGLSVINQFLLDPNELIVAELRNGNYLSLVHDHNVAYLHDCSLRIRDRISGVILNRYDFVTPWITPKIKYNPISNRLYLCHANSNLSQIELSVFNVIHNYFDIINNIPNFGGDFEQVTQNDEIYVVRNQQIMKYTNTGFQAIYLPLLNNKRIYPLLSNNPYTEDRFMFGRVNDFNNFFSFDFSNYTFQSINTSNCTLYDFVYDNNFVYVGASGKPNMNTEIGTHQTFLLNDIITPAFPSIVILTKLDLNTDFYSSKQTTNPFVSDFMKVDISIQPNPSISTISICLKNTIQKNNTYKLTISNIYSKNAITKLNYTLNTPIDISKLPNGANFVTLVDEKGKEHTLTFIKL